jgi:hypothetical protein
LLPFYDGDFCPAVRMSGDGSTLIQHCYNYSPDPTDAGARLVTLKRQGSNWVHAADLDFFEGFSTQWPAISHDANALALRIGPLNQDVQVWRWKNSGWLEEATLRTPVPSPEFPTPDAFGYALEFNRTGSLLAVGAPGSGATGAGVSETPTTWAEERVGAVFLFQRRASNASWSLRSQIKAPNPQVGDEFGLSMALCGTGRTLAVGAQGEDSRARGVDGNQSNNSAPDAGAAYLY